MTSTTLINIAEKMNIRFFVKNEDCFIQYIVLDIYGIEIFCVYYRNDRIIKSFVIPSQMNNDGDLIERDVRDGGTKKNLLDSICWASFEAFTYEFPDEHKHNEIIH